MPIKTTTTEASKPKMDDLWAQWALPTQPDGKVLSLDKLSLDSTTLNQRQIKLQIYKDIISFYHQETNDKMFKKRWEELHDPKVVGMSLKARLESGQKGKESANAKYKDHNWFGAMYTYALAWGCLIPYHPDSMPAPDPKKGEIASFEAAIWSNVAACAITGSTDTKVESAQQPKVIQIGIRAAKCCLEMKDLASVGIIKKACNRGITLQEKLTDEQRSKVVTAEEVGLWKKQVEMLQGVEDKMMFGKIAAGKKLIWSTKKG